MSAITLRAYCEVEPYGGASLLDDQLIEILTAFISDVEQDSTKSNDALTRRRALMLFRT